MNRYFRLHIIVYSLALFLGTVSSFLWIGGSCGTRVGVIAFPPFIFLAATGLLARDVYFLMNHRKHLLSLMMNAVLVTIGTTMVFSLFFPTN